MRPISGLLSVVPLLLAVGATLSLAPAPAAAECSAASCVDGDPATEDECSADGACAHTPCSVVFVRASPQSRRLLDWFERAGFSRVTVVAPLQVGAGTLARACLVVYDGAVTRWHDAASGGDPGAFVAALRRARDAGVPLLLTGQRLSFEAYRVAGVEELTHFANTCSTTGAGYVGPTAAHHPVAGRGHAAVEAFYYLGELDRTTALGLGEVVVLERTFPHRPIVLAYETETGGRVVSIAIDPERVRDEDGERDDDQEQLDHLLGNAVRWLRVENPERTCDDGDRCTYEFMEDGGACGHGPVACATAPDDPCGTAYCDPERGCVPGAVCDDDDPCTLDECMGGVCSHTARCDDLDGCTRDTCAPTTGACAHETIDDEDRDGDGYPACNDCDDDDPDAYPGATEIPCNGRDDDCAAWTLDVSNEICGNDRDDDCDGWVDEQCLCSRAWCEGGETYLANGGRPTWECTEAARWDVGPGPQLHVVTYTGPGQTASGCGNSSPADAIRLVIGCTAAPLVLVLQADAPQRWSIEPTFPAGPGGWVERVYLCGDGGSTVSGIPAERVLPCPAFEPVPAVVCANGAPDDAWPDLAALEAATGARRASAQRCDNPRVQIAYDCATSCPWAGDECPFRTCGASLCGRWCGTCAPSATCTGDGRCVTSPDCDDPDGDGFGAGADCLGDDCDESDPGTHERAWQIPCNGVDEACGRGDADATDRDGDGWDVCAPGAPAIFEDGRPIDCDDGDPAVHPGAAEVPCNGLDDDCDPSTPDAVDADGDGWDVCPPDAAIVLDCLPADCDDRNPAVHPGAVDRPGDGVDADCDGTAEAIDDPPDPGEEAFAPFVAPRGNDAWPGTPERPKRTIGAALAAIDEARASTGNVEAFGRVFVAAGIYAEDVVTSETLLGGYDETDWSRDIHRQRTIVSGTLVVRRGEGAPPSGITPLVVQGLTVRHPPGGGRVAGRAETVRVESDPLRVVQLEDLVVVGAEGYDATCGLALAGAGEVRVARSRIDGGAGRRSAGLCGGGAARLVVVASVVLGGDGAAAATPVDVGVDLDVGDAWIVNSVLVGGAAGPVAGAVRVYADALHVVNSVVDTGGARDAVAIWHESGPLTLLGNDLWAPRGALLHAWADDVADVGTLNACGWTGCAAAADNLSVPAGLDADYEPDRLGPLVDTGVDPTSLLAWEALARDLDGDERPAGWGWDIGAQERTAATQPPTDGGGSSTDTAPDAAVIRVDPLDTADGDTAGAGGGSGGCGGCAEARPRGRSGGALAALLLLALFAGLRRRRSATR